MESVPLLARLWSLFLEPLRLSLCLLTYHLPRGLTSPFLSFLPMIGVTFDIAQSHNYQPHPTALAEGYYTRITTSTGGTVLIIFSSVRNAKQENKPHVLHFSYHPRSSQDEEHSGKGVSVNVFPQAIAQLGKSTKASQELEIAALDGFGNRIGTYSVYLNGKARYRLTIPEENGMLEVDIKLNNRIPWQESEVESYQSPEGPFAALIHLLPIHWYVWSVSSEADVKMWRVMNSNTGGYETEKIWHGRGRAHVEKNWGRSFPTGWVW